MVFITGEDKSPIPTGLPLISGFSQPDELVNQMKLANGLRVWPHVRHM